MSYDECVIKILKELSGCKEIHKESLLEEDLGIDSLGMVMLLIAIEDNFDIWLDESDMDPLGISTVEDVIELVYKYGGDAA